VGTHVNKSLMLWRWEAAGGVTLGDPGGGNGLDDSQSDTALFIRLACRPCTRGRSGVNAVKQGAPKTTTRMEHQARGPEDLRTMAALQYPCDCLISVVSVETSVKNAGKGKAVTRIMMRRRFGIRSPIFWS
jgi:hypothetical protein